MFLKLVFMILSYRPDNIAIAISDNRPKNKYALFV